MEIIIQLQRNYCFFLEIENTTISVDRSNNVELEKFKTSLLECTVQRFTGGRGLIQGQKRQVYTTDITSNTNYILAALLDPRIKTAPFIGKLTLFYPIMMG
jgi:hypothetical protein